MALQNGVPSYFIASVDTAAIVGIFGSIVGILPPIGALLGVIWYCILFYDRFLGKGKSGSDNEPK